VSDEVVSHVDNRIEGLIVWSYDIAMEKRKLTTVVVLIGLGVLGYFGYMMWSGSKAEESEVEDESVVEESSPFVAEESANPFAESSNPYENIKTNPFE